MQISMPYVATIVGYENVSVLVWLGLDRGVIGVKKRRDSIKWRMSRARRDGHCEALVSAVHFRMGLEFSYFCSNFANILGQRSASSEADGCTCFLESLM
jgi:hypothetical protein